MPLTPPVVHVGGWYGDSLPDGRFVTLLPNLRMLADHGTVGFLTPERQPLFVRLSESGKFAGQSWNTPETLEYDGTQWNLLPPVSGVSPIIYRDYTDGGLQTAPFVYPDGSVSSQGWRFQDPFGRLWTGDETYGPTAAVPDLFQWTDLSRPGDRLVIGQGGQGGVVVWDGAAHRQLAPGLCFAIRARRDGDQCSVSFYRELGGATYECEHHWPTVAELRALPLVSVPPVGPPIPPATSEVPVSVPDYFADVDALYATGHYDLTTKDGCGIFTDAAARMLQAKDANFGHLAKRPGQNQYPPESEPAPFHHAVDNVLYLSPVPGQSIAVDIVSGSGAPGARPTWILDIPRYSPSDWRDPGPQPASTVVRPALRFLSGMSSFDWGTHLDQGWLNLGTQYQLRDLRIVPQSVFRNPRSLAQGLSQLDAALAVLVAQNRQALVVINVDTKEYGMDRNAVRQNTAAINAVMIKYLPAVVCATLCNENQNGNEQTFMMDPYFLLELDGLVDARVPLAWGTLFGPSVAAEVAGGSFIVHHADRALSPDRNGQLMRDAQLRFGKPVVDEEPLGLAEPGTPGQRTSDPEYARALGTAAKQYSLGGLVYHCQAGLRASVAEFGTVHRAGAVAEVEGLGAPVVPPVVPPVGHPVLDVNLIQGGTYDALSDAGYNLVVLQPQFEALVVEAQAWHQRATGQLPTAETLRVMIDIRCVAERYRWVTPRGAWTAALPAGAVGAP